LKAEVISIGDELTSGNRLDTNSQWLSQRLGDLGIQTVFHSTVGDNLANNVAVFRSASQRADIVIATGGLGPTADDLTREAIAQAFDRPLEFRQSEMDHIESLFALRKRNMPERNRVQAMIPAGAKTIFNPHGTAPGIDLEVTKGTERCRLFCLPGVPAEMKEMYQQTIEPILINELGAGSLRWFYHSLKVFGIGESDVERELPDLIARDRDPTVGITVSQATITLRIAALADSEESFRNKIAPTEQSIREKLGLLVFGTGEMDLDEAVAQLLADQQVRLGVAEVGCGVWIASALARYQDAEQHGGLKSARWLPSLPEKEPGQNESTEVQLSRLAEEMLVENPSLDLGLAVGTYPDRSTVQSTKQLPTSDFYMALARRGKSTRQTTITIGAHPDVIYSRLAKTGMNFLRTELLKHA
jgi:nicotinamide-nucleotide amidase